MISVVLATYNEAKNIQRCLKAVSHWADEIIIVDGSSTDQTPQLAKKLGARVYDTTNKVNFHINKQMAMDKAKGDLVLQLDADEVVDGELQSFIKKTHQQLLAFKKNLGLKDFKNVQQQKKSLARQLTQAGLASAWWLKRKNLFLGRWLSKGGQYPDPVIRLYVNGLAHLPQKDVHEQMVAIGTVSQAEGHLLHYSNPTFADYIRKFNAYTSLKAEQLAEAKVQLSITNHFKFLAWLPLTTFFSLYVRHKGCIDGVAGLIFAGMSGLYHAVAYLKLWELKKLKRIN